MHNQIDKIIGDLVFYLHPEFFQEEYAKQNKPGVSFNKKITQNYYVLIVAIKWFLKKISRYETYFINFYPDTKLIKNSEALEHHIDAYLEDLETTKNKLVIYISSLKNNLKKIVSNKDEINKALTFLNSKIYIAFDNASKCRGEHRHKGFRFVDKYVLDCEMAENLLDDNFPLKEKLTTHAREIARKKKKDSFEQGKKHWSKNASKNYDQLSGLIDDVMGRTKNFLYQLLDIKTINSLDRDVSVKHV